MQPFEIDEFDVRLVLKRWGIGRTAPQEEINSWISEKTKTIRNVKHMLYLNHTCFRNGD